MAQEEDPEGGRTIIDALGFPNADSLWGAIKFREDAGILESLLSLSIYELINRSNMDPVLIELVQAIGIYKGEVFMQTNVNLDEEDSYPIPRIIPIDNRRKKIGYLGHDQSHLYFTRFPFAPLIQFNKESIHSLEHDGPEYYAEIAAFLSMLLDYRYGKFDIGVSPDDFVEGSFLQRAYAYRAHAIRVMGGKLSDPRTAPYYQELLEDPRYQSIDDFRYDLTIELPADAATEANFSFN